MIKVNSRNILKIPRNLLFYNKIFYYSLLFAIVIILNCQAVLAQSALHIEVIALFENKAMLHINNEQILVKVGETTQHGVTLVSANARGAEIEVDGVTRQYTLGNVVRIQKQDASTEEQADIIVYRGPDTMYRTTGSMNGFPVNFLVDTGASSIAMSSDEAKRLGINYKLDGKPTWVSTASGVEKAMTVVIDRVTISGTTIRSVEGLVIEGSEPSTPLLGMSYLNRFKIVNDGNLMKLKRKY